MRPYSGTVVVAMLCAVVYALSSGASIGMILPVFDDVLSGREGDRTGRSIGAILSEDVLPLAGSAFERLAGFDLDGSVEAFSETGAAARAVPVSTASMAASNITIPRTDLAPSNPG